MNTPYKPLTKEELAVLTAAIKDGTYVPDDTKMDIRIRGLKLNPDPNVQSEDVVKLGVLPETIIVLNHKDGKVGFKYNGFVSEFYDTGEEMCEALAERLTKEGLGSVTGESLTKALLRPYFHAQTVK